MCFKCGRFVSQNADVCKFCGTKDPAIIRYSAQDVEPVQESNIGGMRMIMGVIAIVIVFIVTLCNHEVISNVDQEVTINRNCFGAKSKKYFEELVHTSLDHDNIGILEMMYSDKIRHTNSGTSGKLLEDGGTCYKIRLYDDNRAWWVSRDHVDKR